MGEIRFESLTFHFFNPLIMFNFKKGKIFEDYVEHVYQLLLDSETGQDDEPVMISRNVKLSKQGYSSEFDIYYEFSKAGVRHKVAIECKNHNKPIDISHIRNFNDKIRDFNVTGVFISNSGFQSGAKSYAAEKGIMILTTNEIPNFINLIGLRLKQIYLPSKFLKGEPFYILMEHKNGELTGSYHVIEYKAMPKAMFLFLSKRLALNYLKCTGEKDLFIRGLKQEAFDFIIMAAEKFDAVFRVVCAEGNKNGDHMMFDLTPNQLKDNYFDLKLEIE